MRKRALSILGLLVLASFAAIAALAQNSGSKTKTVQSTNSEADEGERRFQQNCGRCHNPPDALSPREVKAVLQHMRVRAMLSAEDERLILKYLAP